ncbi:MAG: GNAT family N-acetyltransferase [Beijerinckiaceae bacterium]|nr:GNAT family N-acetyltransferase [Beijerinckiaceae bacterium]MCZ8300841.1 GNAT family N-acetyltransferase [Beijerinckiaceae bacterium]
MIIAPARMDDLLSGWRRHWRGESIVTPRRRYGPAEVHAFAARDGAGAMTGLVTFAVQGGLAELVSLNTEVPQQGVGTNLMDAAEREARQLGATRMILATTNNNLGAFRFFQKRGYHLVALHRDAVAGIRREKPSIPMVDPDGLPIRDLIDLEKTL